MNPQSKFLSSVKLFRLLVLIMLQLLTAQTVFAESGANLPRLREYIEVNSELVTLGNLFDDLQPRLMNTAVFRAPDPGVRGVVSVDQIATMAAKMGLDAFSFPNHSQVSVYRTGRLIGEEDAIVAFKQRLMKELDIINERQLTIRFNQQITETYIDSRNAAPVIINDFSFNPASGVFSGRLTTQHDKYLNLPPMTVSGVAYKTVPVARLVRQVNRGEILQPSDIFVDQVQDGRVATDFISSPELGYGMALRRNLGEGEIIRSSDLVSPKLVERNTMVTVSYVSGGISLKMMGKSLQDGAFGEVVRVMNLTSNNVIQAQVIGNNQVYIGDPLDVSTTASIAPRP